MLITKHQVGVSKHIGNYSDGAVVGPNARWLHISGTPGLDPATGKVPDGIIAQAELTWQNIFATLKAAGMTPDNLVKATSYIVRREDIAEYMKVKAKYLGDIRPAQLLLVVDGHFKPEFLIEVDAIAAAE
jgi:2-iminobutanoate/2-iminopropanoate deaminase